MVQLFDRLTMPVLIEGQSPLIFNRMSAKAKRELLLSKSAGKVKSGLDLKHDPPTEYRESLYHERGFHPDTAIFLPSVCFKKAIALAAVAFGDKKVISGASVRRMSFIPGERTPIYGIPRLRCDIVRNAGINGAPDVRTRACLPRWFAEFEIQFPRKWGMEAMATLIRNAGMISGVGDWRQEKGSGNFGLFDLVQSRAAFDRELMDADAQWGAIENPEPYDSETALLLSEWSDYVATR